VDVTLPMLELARLRIRGLVRLVEKTKRNPVYTDFTDELGAATEITLPGTTPGIDYVFPNPDVTVIVEILNCIRPSAVASGAA
jgi:hypothetical protein